MKLLDNVIEYVYELTDSWIFPEELSLEKQGCLPVFIVRNYSLNLVNILGKEYLLLIHQHGEKPAPSQAITCMNMVRDNLQVQAVFVFPRLDAYVRNRLIRKKVPFIIPFQHLYLPQVVIDIREQPSKISIMDRGLNSISDPAQVMLLYYLSHRKHTHEWPLKKWSEQLNYSGMSISRAWKELAAIDLCEGQKKGRYLFLQFPGSNRELWQRALPFLHSPVRHRKIAIIINSHNLELLKAGVSALAANTLLMEGARSEYALKLSSWNTALKNKNVAEVSAANELGVAIETWSYDPRILAPTAMIVDVLSLYLSLQYKSDERIQGALKELLDKFPW